MRKKKDPSGDPSKRKGSISPSKLPQAMSTDASSIYLKRKVEDVSESPQKVISKKQQPPFRLNAHNDEGESLTPPKTGKRLILNDNEQDTTPLTSNEQKNWSGQTGKATPATLPTNVNSNSSPGPVEVLEKAAPQPTSPKSNRPNKPTAQDGSATLKTAKEV